MTTEPTKKERDPKILKQVREQVERLARLEALGQRAVACKGLRWMAGMLGLSNHSSERSIWIRVVDPPMDDTSECWPDFSDPATVGCLLALVREALDPRVWGSPLCLAKTKDGWELGYFGHFSSGDWFSPFDTHSTEAEALVAALEAAS